jgi:hypothetical protein
MAPMLCGDLTQFVCGMFDQPHLVRAYFRPTTLAALGSGIGRHGTVLPFEVALSGAKRAWAMPLLLRHERPVASVAALAYPCAIFLAADPSSRSYARCGGNAPAEELSLLRQILLDDSLRALRASNPQLGAALGAALGVAHRECEDDQIARLVSSVRLATMAIDQLWSQVTP